MNAPIVKATSFPAFAAAFGMSASRMLSTVARTDAQIVERVADGLARTPEGSRLDAKKRKDAATVFTTNTLRTSLAPEIIEDDQVYLFTPGRTGDERPILASSMRARLGDQFLDWKGMTHTGQAKVFGFGTSLRELPNVGYADDLVMTPLCHYGIGMEWDSFDLIRAGLNDVDHEGELRYAASKAMFELYEEIACWGIPEQGIPGFCLSGTASTFDLAQPFSDPAMTADQMSNQLNIIHKMIQKLMRGRKVTGLLMPTDDALRMKDIFGGDNKEGDNRYEHALRKHYWLDPSKVRVIEDDRVGITSNKPFSTWEIWSQGEDFYIEGSPTPLLFGPYMNGETTRVIMMNQVGGAICKNPRLHLRIRFGA